MKRKQKGPKRFYVVINSDGHIQEFARSRVGAKTYSVPTDTILTYQRVDPAAKKKGNKR